MQDSLKLTKDNIEEWKKAYGKYFLDNYQVEGYDTCLSDDNYIDLYEGMTVEEAAAEEISNWEP